MNDELALLWMVNMGCIDMNAWYSRIDKPERPDFVLFDLDPSPDVGFAETIEVALLVKQALDALGLESVAKTSGSEGIHVLVPVARRHTYADTREFSAIIGNALARTHRGLVTTEWTRAKRRGVLIDSNQNGEGKTNILEAISFLCLTKSFYASGDALVVRIGAPRFEIDGTMSLAGGAELNVRVAYAADSHEKIFSINKRRVEPFSSVIGKFPIVVCSPEHGPITSGGPAERRRFRALFGGAA